MKRALVFQHMDTDDLGRFAGLLAADGIATDTVMLHHGHAIPSLAPYDLMVVLGGAMDVWMEDQYPWLRDEKAAIQQDISEQFCHFNAQMEQLQAFLSESASNFKKI